MQENLAITLTQNMDQCSSAWGNLVSYYGTQYNHLTNPIVLGNKSWPYRVTYSHELRKLSFRLPSSDFHSLTVVVLTYLQSTGSPYGLFTAIMSSVKRAVDLFPSWTIYTNLKPIRFKACQFSLRDNRRGHWKNICWKSCHKGQFSFEIKKISSEETQIYTACSWQIYLLFTKSTFLDR